MTSVASPKLSERAGPFAGEARARARTSATRCLKDRSRPGEDFVEDFIGLHTSLYIPGIRSRDSAAVASSPPGERRLILEILVSFAGFKFKRLGLNLKDRVVFKGAVGIRFES